MHIGYKRVSTGDQSTARQLVGIELQRVYEDYASGANADRPQLKRCLDALREGDTLHVHAVDRLSRSMRDLLDIVDIVCSKEVVNYVTVLYGAAAPSSKNPCLCIL